MTYNENGRIVGPILVSTPRRPFSVRHLIILVRSTEAYDTWQHHRVAQPYDPLEAMVTSLVIAIIEAYELRISDFFKKGVRSSTDSKSVKAQLEPIRLLTFRPY